MLPLCSCSSNDILDFGEQSYEYFGCGQVFVEYSDLQGSAKAKQALHNRKFGGKSVIATYYSEDKFTNGDYGG